MSIDYRYMGGIVGQYRGSDVFVIPKKDFSIDRSKGDRSVIFALSSLEYEGLGRKPESLLLVASGMVIGEMSPEGEVEMYERSYEWGESVKNEEEEEISIEEVAPKVEYVSKSVEDYLAGETLADRFLREMAEW